MPGSAGAKESTGAFYERVDNAFYAAVAQESGGKLPADLIGPNGKPRKLTTSPADARYREKWHATAAGMRNSKAVPQKKVSSPCVPCILKSVVSGLLHTLLTSKGGKPVNLANEELHRYSPPYEPERWNRERVLLSANCYAYAANDPDNHPLYMAPQPGQQSGEPYRSLTCADVSIAALQDGMTPAPDPPLPKAGYYPVALVIAPGEDYHWYRLDSNGLWSHKRGLTEATNVDAKGDLIVDPKKASRDYPEVVRDGERYPPLNYSEFCRYFYVPASGLRTGPE